MTVQSPTESRRRATAPRGASPGTRPACAFGAHLGRFARDEGGNATIEFVLFVPFFFVLFLSTFEMGMLMVRQTMLDRGVEMTVRLIRTNRMVDADGEIVVTRANIQRSICFFSGGLIPRCEERLRVEMMRADPHDWSRLPLAPDCRDADDPDTDPAGPFDAARPNELIFFRACALFDPYAPTSALGAGLHRQSGDLYAMFSTSAFSVEPR